MIFSKTKTLFFCFLLISCANSYVWKAPDASLEQTNMAIKLCKKKADRLSFKAIYYDDRINNDDFSSVQDNQMKEFDRIKAKEEFEKTFYDCMTNKGYKKIKN